MYQIKYIPKISLTSDSFIIHYISVIAHYYIHQGGFVFTTVHLLDGWLIGWEMGQVRLHRIFHYIKIWSNITDLYHCLLQCEIGTFVTYFPEYNLRILMEQQKQIEGTDVYERVQSK